MFNKYIFLGFQVLACICFTTIYSDPTGRACYHAKVCVHNAVEKCGIDSKGKLRKFIDSCDLKEYNCLKGTDFEKTLFEKCASLPSPKEDRMKEDKTKEKEEVESRSQDTSETATKKSLASKNQNDNSKKKKVKTDKKDGNLKLEKEDSANTNQEQESVVNADQANGEENVGKDPKKMVQNKNVSKSQANVDDGADFEGNAKNNDNSQNNDNDNDNDNEDHEDEVHEDNKKD